MIDSLVRFVNSLQGRIWRSIHLPHPDSAAVDLSFVSYPKSGRTWLRFLIGRALVAQYNLDERYVPETFHLTRQLPVPTMQFVHNGMDPDKADRFKYGAMPRDQERFTGRDVCFLVRDPRDILVSAYYWATRHRRVYSDDMSAFIRSEEHGLRKIIQFYNLWHECRVIPKSFYLLSYESLQAAPLETLKDLFRHLAIDIHDEHLRTAIELGSFEHMRRWEQLGKSRFLTPRNLADKESYKTRAGKVGSHRGHFSEADRAFLDDVLRQMGCPFLQDSKLRQHHEYGLR